MFIVVSNFTGGGVWLRGGSNATTFVSPNKKLILANSTGTGSADELTTGTRPYIVGAAQNHAIDSSIINKSESILVVRANAAPPRITYFSSTNAHTLGTSNYSPADDSTSNTHFHIGNAGSSTPFNGTINEFLIYKGVLNDTDRVSVTTYLMNKWGIFSS
jgi:hypothetical protein